MASAISCAAPSALHAHAAHADADARRAPLENVEHVLQHRALQRRDDADDLRENGQLALAVELEQALGRKLALQLLEALLQAALPARADFRDLNLVLPARFVDGDRPAREHGLAVRERETDAPRLALEHHRGERRRRVLEREVEMARAGRAEIGDFPRDPDLADAASRAGRGWSR